MQQAPHTGSQRDRIADALLRAQWQTPLFTAPSRAQLVQLVPQWDCRRLRVAVHRNHAIEPVTSIAAAYAGWNRLHYDWVLGPYDDSLAFAMPVEADVHVVWLDTNRMQVDADELGQWLSARIADLRHLTTSPIVVAAWPLSTEVRAAISCA
jgi:hypothetical protein